MAAGRNAFSQCLGGEMAAWVMLLGMITLINVTMVGAVMQLAGNIPDASLLVILSRYLGRRKKPPQALLHPLEASSKLQRLRRKSLLLAAVFAAAGFGFTIWALAAGWGPVGMTALTMWLLAANVAFLDVPLASLRRRTYRMRPETPGNKREGDGSAGGKGTGGNGTQADGEENAPS